MFDKFRLKAALVEYKKRFVQTQWPDEKYKWEAVKCFQVNWDVNADDFAGMLTKALSQTSNLLASVNNFPARMITKFAEIAGEEVYIPFQVNHLHGQTEPVPRRMRATLTETEPVLFDVNYQTTVC